MNVGELAGIGVPRAFFPLLKRPEPLTYSPEACAYVDAAEIMVKEGIGLYVTGKLGVGKSSLSTWVFIKMVEKGFSGEWVGAVRANEYISRNRVYDREEMVYWTDRLRTVSVLLIDDFKPSEELWGLIHDRAHDDRVTIINSEVPLDRITDERVEAIEAACYPLHLDGPNWLKVKKERIRRMFNGA